MRRLHTPPTKSLAADLTSEPVEYLRPKAAARRYSLSRSSIYLLIQEGKIKSCVLRRRNNTRGARLINAASVEAYLNSLSN